MTQHQSLPTVMVTVYGQPKKKKTSDALAAFPTALFVGVPAALTLVAQNELGYTPSVHPQPPQTLPELVGMLEQLSMDRSCLQPYGALVIDDASHICKQSMLRWEDEAPTGRSGRKDRFYQYQQLDRHLLKMSALSRHLGVHLVLTFHERMPGTNADGMFCAGGPDVPSRNQVKTLPSWCDINVRAMVDPAYPDPWFPSVSYCDPTDPEWITGDRTGVCTRRTTRTRREILRASQSGYRLVRLPGLEWQDEVADAVSSLIVSGVPAREAITEVTTGRTDNSLHLRWACQDGIARGVLAKQAQRSLFDFSSAETETKTSTLPPPPPMNTPS